MDTSHARDRKMHALRGRFYCFSGNISRLAREVLCFLNNNWEVFHFENYEPLGSYNCSSVLSVFVIKTFLKLFLVHYRLGVEQNKNS